MADIVLGPLLRYASATEATIWVECSGACVVEVLGHRAHTWRVAGHHYALVRLRGLEPGSATPYEVTLDGERRWPPVDDEWDFPPSVIRTLPVDPEAIDIAFGSCRLTAPHGGRYDLSPDDDDDGVGVDAMVGLVDKVRHGEPLGSALPHLMLLIGDQVYADDVSRETAEFIRARRDVDEPPGLEVADFDEYAELYRESWSDPPVRWLFSSVATGMVFDDHDVHDDWNTSHQWVAEMRETGWWHERIVSALMTYWIYQHLGNLSPDQLDRDGLLDRMEAAREGEAELRAAAERAECEPLQTQWSWSRDVADGVRLVVVDARAGRVLDPAARDMLDEDEWRWLEGQLTGDVEHLVVASTLPVLLAPAVHSLEAWNEAVAQGAWGSLAMQPAEKLRQGVDLEHWAAFGRSFKRLWENLEDVACGRRGRAPRSIVLLGGDVHHAYLAEVGWKPGVEVQSAVWQAVCSPVRHPLTAREQRVVLGAWNGFAGRIARALAHRAGVEDPPVGWRLVHERPWADNQLAHLRFDGPTAGFRLDRSCKRDDGDAELVEVFARQLA